MRSRDQGRTWQVLEHLTPGSDDEQAGGDPFLSVDRATGRMFQTNWTPPCTPLTESVREPLPRVARPSILTGSRPPDS